MWDRIKDVKWGAIIVEEGGLSLGRIMAWVVFGLLVYMWTTGEQIPPTLVEAFWGLLLYNGGKKFTGPVSDYLKNRKINIPASKEEAQALGQEAIGTEVKEVVSKSKKLRSLADTASNIIENPHVSDVMDKPDVDKRLRKPK